MAPIWTRFEFRDPEFDPMDKFVKKAGLTRCEESRTVEIRKHPMGPVPKWGLYFYWGRGITRVVITAPFIRLTLMPVTQSSGNSYLFSNGFLEPWRAF